MSGTELNDLPTAGITRVQFGNNLAPFLLASSWDRYVRLYDVNKNCLRFKYEHDTPVLDCCLIDNVYSYSGGIAGDLKMFDFNSQTSTQLGISGKVLKLDDGLSRTIRCIRYSHKLNALLTGSWDCTVKIWDNRDRSMVSTTIAMGGKVFAMDCSHNRLVVGTSDRKISIFDLRNTANALQSSKDSSLKYQTRCIRCFTNGNGYILSSIEGRVAVEFFPGGGGISGPSYDFTANPSNSGQLAGPRHRRYAFKCHRTKSADGTKEFVWPVNAIDFHPVHGTFVTGGSDGYVHIWDGVNKKRLFQFTPYHTGVTSLAFSPDGLRMAIAVSFNGEYQLKAGESRPKDSIFIRSIDDIECRPKPTVRG